MLVSTFPHHSKHYGLVSCTIVWNYTLGIYHRLYNFKTNDRFINGLHRWCIFSADIEKGNKMGNDKRGDTYRVTDGRTILKFEELTNRKEQINILNRASDKWLLDSVRKDALQWKRSIGFLMNPNITKIEKKDGQVRFHWEEYGKKHNQAILDWQIMRLFQKYPEDVAINKLWDIIHCGTTWLCFGTHRARPRTQFLIVGFFNFKNKKFKPSTEKSLKLTQFF